MTAHRLLLLSCVFAMCLAHGAWAAPSKVALTYVIHPPERGETIFWNNPRAVATYTTNLYALVAGLESKGAAVDVQVDYNLLTAGYGQLLVDLNGLGASIDVHTHKNDTMNNADVSWMIQSLGLPDTGVLGGYLSSQQPMASETGASTGYVWAPKIIWGEATLNHTDDRPSTGIRREGDLIHTGGQATGVDTLGQLVASLEGSDNTLLTCSFFVWGVLPSKDLSEILEQTDTINALAGNAGYWATLPQIAEDWIAAYNSQASYRTW